MNTYLYFMDVIVYSIPVFFLLILLELLFDYYKGRKGAERKYRLNDAFTNISCGIVDQSSDIFAKVFTVGMYVLAFEVFAQFRFWSLPQTWWMWIIAFFAVDFAYYWAHRWSHGVNLFWLGHVVHHQSEDYNLSVALRQGAFQKVFTFWVYLPLAMIGVSPEWFITIKAINLLYQFWIHTEYVERMGWFEKVLNTPSHHRVHHGSNPKYIDKNHAGVFIIWDKMFGTFQVEEERPTYGITTPTGTFNPIYAHTQPFQRLWAELKLMPSFGDKLRLLFKSPGWYPASLGERPASPVRREKFQRTLSLQENIYLLTQYFILVVITAVFLFTLDLFTGFEKGVYLTFIFIHLLTLGMYFDKEQKRQKAEVFRLMTTMLFSGFVYFQLSQFIPSLILAVLVLISFVWWNKIRQTKHYKLVQ
ncbi:MAG: sterol desaturase family protein [Bacteroidetes bacterium]|nr:sterol desaturase family protein [Bacteroidota bacterium]